MAARDDDKQGHDQWGSPFQNEYGRILGRIEQKVDELKQSANARDEKLSDLTERVRGNAHKANNVAQILNNQVEKLQATSARSEATIDHIDARVSKLEPVVAAVQTATVRNGSKLDKMETRLGAIEAPVRKAVAIRLQRRKMWIKIVSVASGVGIATWAIAEPIWRAVAPTVVQRWFSLPPGH